MTTKKPARLSVKLVDGHATTTSLKIAEAFGKRHNDVLRTIRELECTPEFNARNFAPVEYTDAHNQKRPMYTITRDGFAFLASGFTGKEAAQWKEKYIEAFNALEKAVQEKAALKRLPPAQKSLPAPAENPRSESVKIPYDILYAAAKKCEEARIPKIIPQQVRWLTEYRDGKWRAPVEVPYFALVLTEDDITFRIRERGDAIFTAAFVAEIARACTDRLFLETRKTP